MYLTTRPLALLPHWASRTWQRGAHLPDRRLKCSTPEHLRNLKEKFRGYWYLEDIIDRIQSRSLIALWETHQWSARPSSLHSPTPSPSTESWECLTLKYEHNQGLSDIWGSSQERPTETSRITKPRGNRPWRERKKLQGNDRSILTTHLPKSCGKNAKRGSICVCTHMSSHTCVCVCGYIDYYNSKSIDHVLIYIFCGCVYIHDSISILFIMIYNINMLSYICITYTHIHSIYIYLYIWYLTYITSTNAGIY